MWAALTEPEQLLRWFPDKRAEIDLRPGGDAVLEWDEATAEAVVDVVEPPGHFVFRWRPEGLGRPFTTVSFTLEELEDGASTRVRLVESGFASLPDQIETQSQKGNDEAGRTSSRSSRSTWRPHDPRSRRRGLRGARRPHTAARRARAVEGRPAHRHGARSSDPVSRQAIASTSTRGGSGSRHRHPCRRENRYELRTRAFAEAEAWMRAIGAMWDQRLAAFKEFVESAPSGSTGRRKR